VAAIGDAAHVPVTIGSNLELGIAQAAMIHLAVASPGVRPDILPCDIISRFFYTHDIVQEPLPVEGGVAHAIERPGLGVALDPDAIERCRVE
jgi:muconate cycloisomerase